MNLNEEQPAHSARWELVVSTGNPTSPDKHYAMALFSREFLMLMHVTQVLAVWVQHVQKISSDTIVQEYSIMV